MGLNLGIWWLIKIQEALIWRLLRNLEPIISCLVFVILTTPLCIKVLIICSIMIPAKSHLLLQAQKHKCSQIKLVIWGLTWTNLYRAGIGLRHGVITWPSLDLEIIANVLKVFLWEPRIHRANIMQYSWSTEKIVNCVWNDFEKNIHPHVLSFIRQTITSSGDHRASISTHLLPPIWIDLHGEGYTQFVSITYEHSIKQCLRNYDNVLWSLRSYAPPRNPRRVSRSPFSSAAIKCLRIRASGLSVPDP
jgi:hypothetical protein